MNSTELYEKFLAGAPKGYIEEDCQPELRLPGEIGTRPLCACASGCVPFSQPAGYRCRWEMLHSAEARVLGAKRPGLFSIT